MGAFQGGVLDALLEAGLKPAALAGASIGSANAVLAASGGRESLKFWLAIPEPIQSEVALAQDQAVQLLGTLSVDAKEIGVAAAWSRLLRNAVPGGAAGVAAFFGMANPVGAAGVILWSLIDSKRKGLREAAKLIEERMGVLGPGPLLSRRAAEALHAQLSSQPVATPVFASVSTLKKVTGEQVIQIAKDGHPEVGPGKYLEVGPWNQAHAAIGSMAVPVLFGSNNPVNPSEFLDGGLHDNLPIAAFASTDRQLELDAILVVDVSGGAPCLWSHPRYAFPSQWPKVPVFYVYFPRLAESGASFFLDFSRSKELFALGQRVGREAHERWFARPAQGRWVISEDGGKNAQGFILGAAACPACLKRDGQEVIASLRHCRNCGAVYDRGLGLSDPSAP
jgi:hypothetical protein